MFVAGASPRVANLPARIAARLRRVYGYEEHELVKCPGHVFTHVRVSIGHYRDGAARHVVFVNEFTDDEHDVGIVSLECVAGIFSLCDTPTDIEHSDKRAAVELFRLLGP